VSGVDTQNVSQLILE